MPLPEKPPIRLRKELVDRLRRARDEGRASAPACHAAEPPHREDDWRDARATLDRIFARCPGPEAKHFAWARRALGVGPERAA